VRRREILGGGDWAALAVSISFSSVSIYSGSDLRFGLVSKEEEKPWVFCELLLQENDGGGKGQVQKSPSHRILDGGLRYYVCSMHSTSPCAADPPRICPNAKSSLCL
jgi:hypothetical protein